ncbi:hypothetical protein WT01_06710 [Burkholderia cepacia]|nr:hypothetical protein WT01_06710 [Burkholderia cepacia]
MRRAASGIGTALAGYTVCERTTDDGRFTSAPATPEKETSRVKEAVMSNVLSHWILVGCDAYDEYVFVPWLDKSVYLRTVTLRRVCLL